MTRHTHTILLLVVLTSALILAGCGGDEGGNDSPPEQIVAETIQPTDTAQPTPLPPTWTPAPSNTPAPPPPTVAITPRPTSTVFTPPVATPLTQNTSPDQTGGDPGHMGATDDTLIDPATIFDLGGVLTSPDPIRVDLAPITAGNATQLALIQAKELTFTTDLALNTTHTTNGTMFAAAMPDGVHLFSEIDLTTEQHVLPDAGEDFGFQVESVAFNPNGSQLASGNTNGELVIWDIATSERLFTIQAHEKTVWDIVYSPDGTQIVTGGGLGLIKVWNATTGDLVREIESGDNAIYDLAVYPLSGLVVASGPDSNRPKVWNLSTSDELATMSGHSFEARAVAFGPDGETLASGGDEGSVRIWTVAGAQAGEPLTVLGGHTSMIATLAYSPDSTMMAVGTSTGALALWDLTTSEKLFETQAHIPWVNTILWLPDQTALVTAGFDGTLRVWGVPAQ